MTALASVPRPTRGTVLGDSVAEILAVVADTAVEAAAVEDVEYLTNTLLVLGEYRASHARAYQDAIIQVALAAERLAPMAVTTARARLIFAKARLLTL